MTWNRSAVLAVALLTACSTTEVDCASLDAASCATEAACAVISGRAIVPGGEGAPGCLEAATDEGCRAVDVDCTEAETRAAPPDDPSSCYWFNNGCLPEGWITCDPDPGDPDGDC